MRLTVPAEFTATPSVTVQFGVIEVDVVNPPTVGESQVITGAARSKVTTLASEFAVVPRFPAPSETERERRRSANIPSEHALTVIVNVVPDAALGVNTQPTAFAEVVFAFTKSSAVKPEILSLKVNVYESGTLVAMAAGEVQLAVGAVRSIVNEALVTSVIGPAFDELSTTLFGAKRRARTPSLHPVTVTLNEDPDDAEGVNTHPVAFPVFEKSPAASPEIASLKANWKTIDVNFVGEEILERTPAVGALPEIWMTSVEATDKLPASSTAYATKEPSESPAASIELATFAKTLAATFQ